uniref:Uncharacterized protein n=1 Tax=Rhizophora mucronata TaxID=61149 RepID=A0A2P2R1T6_RHIMU
MKLSLCDVIAVLYCFLFNLTYIFARN